MSVSTQPNTAIVRQFIAALDRGDLDQLADLLTADFRFYPPAAGASVDRDGFYQFVAPLRVAFPDFVHTIQDMIAEGDRVAVRVQWQGTHRGEFQGVPPTGKVVALQGIGTFRLTDGRIAEHWARPDLLSLIQQIVPAAGPS